MNRNMSKNVQKELSRLGIKKKFNLQSEMSPAC
jgi:hypothetical protein